jgi:signal transduction histidine kinase
VLAHNISLINVQSGVALHLIDERPEQARTALVAIKQASKDALREVRATLGALRGVDEEPPRSPTPSLARLDELTARVAGAGLEVRTRVAGEPRQLPAGVDVAAYRIVQEALTNVARHAGPATATIQVTYGERDLTVQVDDDGRGVPAAAAAGAGGGTSGGGTGRGTSSSGGTGGGGGGTGILGMRERATALGGELQAGPRPGRGFRVLARLPLDGTA